MLSYVHSAKNASVMHIVIIPRSRLATRITVSSFLCIPYASLTLMVKNAMALRSTASNRNSLYMGIFIMLLSRSKAVLVRPSR